MSPLDSVTKSSLEGSMSNNPAMALLEALLESVNFHQWGRQSVFHLDPTRGDVVLQRGSTSLKELLLSRGGWDGILWLMAVIGAERVPSGSVLQRTALGEITAGES
jgi:hypothetical protein